MEPVRADLRQRLQNEPSESDPRVGQDEPRGVHDPPVKIQQVQIERPGRIRGPPPSPEDMFYTQKGVEDGLRGSPGGVQKCRRVCERRVGGVGPCFCDAVRRDQKDFQSLPGQTFKSRVQERTASAPLERQVCADRHEGASIVRQTVRDSNVQ